jgi:acyl-CoA dehydrogenase
LDATLSWTEAQWQSATVLAPCPALHAVPDLRTLQATVMSAQLAGALGAVFERTLAHANERQQFGRAIGKFQAIQHQLSVMAEEVFAARMAAQIGCWADGAGDPLVPDRLRVATAKARCSEAALQVASLAHAIHGAIGFTREFDLQLFTRRLHAWRQAAGGESYWQRVLGQALVDDAQGPLLHTLQRISDQPLAL